MQDKKILKEELQSGIIKMRRRVMELELQHDDREDLIDMLQNMEKKYRLLAENACDIITLFSCDGSKCYYINPAIEHVLDHNEAEFTSGDGLPRCLDIVHPEDREILLRAFHVTLEKGTSIEEIRYRKKDGTYLWFEVAGKLICDEGDNTMVLMRARDIDRQKNIEIEMEKQFAELHTGYEQIESLNEQLQQYHDSLLETNARLAHSEERLQLALWGAGQFMWEWSILNGKILVNDTYSNVLGYDWSECEINAQNLMVFCHSEDFAVLSKKLQSYMEGRVGHFEAECRIKNGRNEYIWTLITGKMVFEDNKGRTLRMVGLCQDISEKKQAHHRLEDSEARYRKLFERNPLGLCKVNADGYITDANKVLIDIVGAPSREALLEINLLHDVPEELQELAQTVLCSNEAGSRNGEIFLHTRWGKDVWIYYKADLLNDADGRFQEIIAACEEITDRKQAEDKIRYLSFNDSLTGLYNRAFFEEELKRLDTRRQLPLTIVMGDLNGLKLINDAFGHSQGDLALQQVAEVLRISCRQEDIIARLGGDEFVALLPKTSSQVARNICRRIKENCQKVETSNMKLSIALGMSTKETEEQDIHDIQKQAEERMYRNKLLENRSTRDTFISSLEETLWVRGHETPEHNRRLQEILEAVGEPAGLTDSHLINLSLLASLHDIGKIAIPPSILEKKEQLTDDEWETIKKHPEIGYRIALSTPELAPIAEAILTHHENWDGSGYPLKLKGDSIPILARILSIVDAYEVMRSGRPYQSPISKEQALWEIQECAGTRFDPHLVEIFVNVVRERDDL